MTNLKNTWLDCWPFACNVTRRWWAEQRGYKVLKISTRTASIAEPDQKGFCFCQLSLSLSMFLSTFPVSVSLMIVLDKTYDRPHCHPHLRKIVKKPWCTSCKIVFIFESRTAWNQSIFSSMDWIDSHLSTPYTQETRRTSNNAKSSRFQEGAWDLNQSWCYQLSYPLEALGICIWSLLASG